MFVLLGKEMFLQRQKQYKSFTNRRLYHKNAETKGNFFLFPFCIFDISKHSSLAQCSSDKLLTFIISHFFSRKVVYVLWQEGIKGYFKTIIRKELDNYKELSRLSCENSRNTMIDGSKPWRWIVDLKLVHDHAIM